MSFPYNSSLDTRVNPFTLIEILIVLAIIAIGLALVGSRIGIIPSRVVVRKAKTDLETAFSEARMRARTTGQPTVLNLEVNENRLRLQDLKRTNAYENWLNASGSDQTMPSTTSDEMSEESFQQSYNLEQDIEWDLRNQRAFSKENLDFFFYPDGDATGPEVIFTLRGYIFRLAVARLTGKTRIIELER